MLEVNARQTISGYSMMSLLAAMALMAVGTLPLINSFDIFLKSIHRSDALAEFLNTTNLIRDHLSGPRCSEAFFGKGFDTGSGSQDSGTPLNILPLALAEQSQLQYIKIKKSRLLSIGPVDINAPEPSRYLANLEVEAEAINFGIALKEIIPTLVIVDRGELIPISGEPGTSDGFSIEYCSAFPEQDIAVSHNCALGTPSPTPVGTPVSNFNCPDGEAVTGINPITGIPTCSPFELKRLPRSCTCCLGSGTAIPEMVSELETVAVPYYPYFVQTLRYYYLQSCRYKGWGGPPVDWTESIETGDEGETCGNGVLSGTFSLNCSQ